MAITERLRSALDVASTLSVIAAAAVLIWSIAFRAPQNRGAQAENVDGLRIEPKVVTNVAGSASTVIVEFSDYECPFCAQHATRTFPRIEKELIEKGAVRYAVLNFPLVDTHPNAMKAGEAAECAARQGKYWDMHKRLFASPKALSETDLLGHAAAIDLDAARFKSCLGGEAAEKVKADLAEGQRLGVTGTPAFFVGNVESDGAITLKKRLVGAVSYDQLAAEVASCCKADRLLPPNGLRAANEEQVR